MRKKILIVDDNELIVEMMSFILSANGYDVKSLPSGEYIMREIDSSQPDLLIMDVMLPGVDGINLCRILKHNKATEKLPVIICSGSADLEKTLLADGAPDDYLRKPFDLSTFINKVAFQLAA
ncbi:response regulator transcription factor [Mucilaginibacter segetis]|uniref:Response regulator n=1 Tax=Mucilaginibacter segetis TaxID=2793071 RepID=A0A934PSF8_9SPHI|nr:response regulator [Mucilaginibacter segetis]MBK0379969.1 response regulator [Mucilaginibacter segetis]